MLFRSIKYRGDVAGSDKAFGFCHRGTDNQLFVFEAAIDPFGNENGSGEAVDQEVALGLAVGVHGNEGVDGVHGADVESVVHGNEMMFVQWLRLP